jgi:hypothetical protein
MMLYKEFEVKGVRTEHFSISARFPQECVIYNLVSREGEEVSFSLIIGGCSGEEQFRKQYEVVRSHLLVGVRISCRIAYTYRGEYLSMGMTSFAVCGKNPWEISDWYSVPDLIEFSGDVRIPLCHSCITSKHVSGSHASDLGSVSTKHQTKRQPFLSRVHKALKALLPA